MGRIIKNADATDVTSASLDEEVLTAESDRIPAEQVETEGETAQEEAQTGASDGVAPQGRVLRAGQAGRSSEPVTVRPEEVQPPEADDDSAPAPDAAAAAEAPEDEAASPDPARSDEEWREHLEEEVEAARAEAYEAGREDGYEAGYDDGSAEAEEAVRAELEETRRQLIADTAQFEQCWDAYIDEAESQIVELSLDLAEAIVDAPFTETMRRAAEEAVVEAVTELSGTPPVTIRLHPVDCQRVRELGLMERLNENFDGLTLEPEPDFEEGDWSVSSPTGVVRRLRAEVLETLRDELRRARANAEDASGPDADSA